MTRREEHQQIAELMDEWEFSEYGEFLSFREWLAQTHPDKLEMVERLLGPERPPMTEQEELELKQVKHLTDEWDLRNPGEPDVFRDWLKDRYPHMLPIVERVLGPDPRSRHKSQNL